MGDGPDSPKHIAANSLSLGEGRRDRSSAYDDCPLQGDSRHYLSLPTSLPPTPVRRLRCSSLNGVLAECRADFGQGPGHTLQNVNTTNHQSPNTLLQSPSIPPLSSPCLIRFLFHWIEGMCNAGPADRDFQSKFGRCHLELRALNPKPVAERRQQPWAGACGISQGEAQQHVPV